MVIDLPVVEGGKQIGKIDIKSGEVIPADNMPVSWNCCLSGECCQRFHIPVTDFDIERIETHGYALDQIISDQSPFVRMPKNQFGSIEKNYHIKRKPFDNSCTFLTEDGLCGIHQFRPFGCRIFPFQFRFDDEEVVRVTIHESNFCHNVERVPLSKAQNEKFLIYLKEELIAELERRRDYFEKYGDQI